MQGASWCDSDNLDLIAGPLGSKVSFEWQTLMTLSVLTMVTTTEDGESTLTFQLTFQGLTSNGLG